MRQTFISSPLSKVWRLAVLLATLVAGANTLRCAESNTFTLAGKGEPRVPVNTEEAPAVAVTDNWEQHVPANQTRGKTDLYGTDAVDLPGTGGKVLIKGAKIVQFPLNGDKPELIADSPSCIYDLKHQEINSSSPLHVHAQDGKLFVEGTGFFLQQKDLTLTISNDVHTIIKTQPGTNDSDPGTDIRSQRGRFEMKATATNGLAIYQGDVRVVDPKMQLWCELLTAELPKSSGDQTNRPKHIVAETNVVIDFINERGEKNHATGDKAIYDYQIVNGVTNEVLELIGNPKVQLTNGWMTANSFVMNRTTGKLVARGDCHFHYEAPRDQSVVGTAKPNAPATPSEIFSDNFEFDTDTRVANFWGKVRVEDARMILSCATLAANLPKQEANAPSRIEHILAETNVVIDFTDDKTGQRVHATGEKAAYDYRVKNGVTNEVLALSGNPEVQTFAPHAGWMTADVITVDHAQGKLWGVGNHHSVFKKQPGEAATLDTEIFSDEFEFTLGTGIATYQGKVRAYDPSMNLTSKKLTAKFAKNGQNQTNSIQRADAQGDVVIDFIDKPFAVNDITNLPAFAGRLQKSADPVAGYIQSQLTAPSRALLTNYTNGANPNLQLALSTELNRLTQSGAVYDANRFTNVFLSLETSELMHAQPLGVELTRLNRLLLLDAFRGEIARNEKGEKTHATGDAATYLAQGSDSATNAFLELRGHPRLDTPTRWITADDTITDDRTTGLYHAVGNPHFHSKVSGLAQRKPEHDPRTAQP